jgi:hypothetical protein
MHRILKIVLAMPAIAVLLQAAHAEPSPRNGSRGPSLEATLQFIADKLGANGSFGAVVWDKDLSTGSTSEGTYQWEFTNVRADAASCSLLYHLKITSKGTVTINEDRQTGFAKFEDLVAEPLAQSETQANASAGIPNWIGTATNPEITAILLRGESGVDFRAMFYFADPNLADRVAKAMAHAIELCGVVKSEPF